MTLTGFGLCLLLLSGLFGCDSERKESDECLESRLNAKNAVLGGDVEQGATQLARAKELCGSPSAYDIDRLERLVERARRREQLAKKAQEDAASPLADFVAWAEKLREADDKSIGQTECVPRGKPEFGLCTSHVQREGAPTYNLDYFREDHQAFRFRTTMDKRLSCLDLGQHRDLSSWTDAGKEYERCDLTSHGLLGLRVLIERDSGSSRVSVFSADYPKRDPELASKLKR